MFNFLLSFVVGLSFSMSSYALPGFSFLKTMHQKKVAHAPLKTSQPAFPINHYSDFSGTWKGGCIDHQGKMNLDGMTIVNNADWFDYKEEETGRSEHFVIGAMQSFSSAQNNDHAIDHTMLMWNEDKTRLMLRNVSLEQGEEGPIYTYLVQATFSLQHSLLIVNTTMRFIEDLQEYEVGSVTCTYSKFAII